MFLTFTPTDGTTSFRFNSKQEDGSVSLVTCPGPCHVEVTERTGRNLLRDYSSLFVEGKERLPRKAPKAISKDIPGGVEPTADKMVDPPDATKTDFDDVSDGSQDESMDDPELIE